VNETPSPTDVNTHKLPKKIKLHIKQQGDKTILLLEWWLGRARLIGTIDDKGKFTVDRIVEIDGWPEAFKAPATTKEEFEKAMSDPPGPTPEQAALAREAKAGQTFNEWLGREKNRGWGRTIQELPRVRLRTEEDGRTLWGIYRVDHKTLEVFAEVPPGTPNAQQIEDKHFVKVDKKEDLAKLPPLA
jgi:hypothetical protein